jgi:serine/threonine protein phosphatase PrpC
MPNSNNNNLEHNKDNKKIIKQNSQNINHFPNPEKPVRKESKSSNITYNPFNASGWLKNFAVTTHPGVDKNGNQKTNQDSFVFKTNINGISNYNIFGVMDGHGSQGHFVSQFASKFIPFQIINHREIKSLTDPEEIYQKLKYNEYEIINQIFLETDNQLQKVNFDATESGCTCVLVIHIGSHIICANTGDSRAILILDSLGENNINDFYEVPLSYDYKPEMPEEKQRIELFGGVVEQLKNKNGEGVGPYRVWAKEGGYPGLAMSRSIGDLIGKKLGVIPNPGILEYELNETVKFIVVASDGIWEFISNEIVRNIGKQFYKDKDPKGFCHEIVKDAYKLWKENGITVDDITAIAAFF